MSSESLVQGGRAAQRESFRVMVGLVWVSVSTLPFVSSSVNTTQFTGLVRGETIQCPTRNRPHEISVVGLGGNYY